MYLLVPGAWACGKSALRVTEKQQMFYLLSTARPDTGSSQKQSHTKSKAVQ